MQMMPGETYQLTATVLPPNTADGAYAWNNSKPEVAVIDPSGRITALTAGKTEVYAYTTADGRRSRRTCTVNVSERQPKYRALLIGNENPTKESSYKRVEGPINDMIRMGTLLKSLSFHGETYQVHPQPDLKRNEMVKQVTGMKDWGIADEDVTLIFFSGHGSQVGLGCVAARSISTRNSRRCWISCQVRSW